MKYNFDEIIPRRGTNSVKWDLATDERVLPMWVADMDFRAAPPVLDALERRLRHGVFGYTKVPDAYFEAVKGWFGKRHGFRIENEWILPTTGVIPALSVILKALTGDKVILQTPVYNCFFAVLERTGRQPLANPLINENGAYRMDFEDLERKAADPQAKLIFLCNPHNPAGRAWTAEELTRLGEICLRHGVFVVADEIHCELTYEGHDYTPFASLSERFLMNSATCVSPSKAFNLAGLQIADIVAADEQVRRRIDRAVNINEVCDVNPFGVAATIAAYDESGAWLDALRKYLWGNYEYLRRFFEERLPQYPVLPLEGTYLVWIDCRATGIGSDDTALRLQEEQKLMVNSGTLYGPGGEGFIRLNIACPRTLLADGLERTVRVLERRRD